MNKNTFTRLIQNSNSISDAEMLALEQVVQAFPYCHVAHMLLAKASHDKGSMMAPQRLRKAAIHAPSRAILKKLIESAPEKERQFAYAEALAVQNEYAAAQAEGVHSLIPEFQEELEDLIENDFPENTTEENEEAAEENNLPAAEAQILAFPAPTYSKTGTENFWAAELAGAEAEEEPEADILKNPNQEGPKTEGPEDKSSSEPVTDPETYPAFISASESVNSNLTAETNGNAAAAGALLPEAETEPAEQAEPEVLPEISDAENKENLERSTAEIEEALPESDQLISRNEQEPETNNEIEELAQTEKAAHEKEPEVLSHDEEYTEQSGIKDEEDPAVKKNDITEPVTTENTGTREEKANKDLLVSDNAIALKASAGSKISEPVSKIYSDELIQSIFRNNELGYSMISSRMGECLQRKSDLTTEVPFHFQPELLVEFKQTKTEITEPELDAVAAQHEIINDFLRQASKGRNRINQAAKAEEQQDLSSKSTKLSKTLVSENLAQIFAMQGKNKKAIKIYQQLQLKMPEKKEYFASQIIKLQNNT